MSIQGRRLGTGLSHTAVQSPFQLNQAGKQALLKTSTVRIQHQPDNFLTKYSLFVLAMKLNDAVSLSMMFTAIKLGSLNQTPETKRKRKRVEAHIPAVVREESRLFDEPGRDPPGT
jgi:hypothetical protein